MASTSDKKLPQAWHTKSFYLTRFWMSASLVCLVATASVLQGKFPTMIGCSPMFLFMEIFTIAECGSETRRVQPFLRSGSPESQHQHRQLLWCIFGITGGYTVAFAVAYYLYMISAMHPHLLAILFVGANISGWHLTAWYKQIAPLLEQHRDASTPPPTVAPVAAPLPPMRSVATPQPQILRAGNANRP